MAAEIKTMRDAMIKKICQEMQERENIFFVSADMGAPTLDELRTKFKDRFISVGIAEQNLINVSTGLALESYTVYSYGIAPFLTMRAYEQIKNNIALMSQIKKDMNINLMGVGVGLSYDLSGPSHHALEDMCIMRALPNLIVFSPSDWVLAEKFVDYSIKIKRPKYARLDGKPVPRIYDAGQKIDFQKGFCELVAGEKVCLVATGVMTQRALEVAGDCLKNGMKVGVLDIFLLKPLNYDSMYEALKKYECVITMEEGFINKGGVDGLVSDLLNTKQLDVKLINLGLKDRYIFEMGNRNYLHKLNYLDKESVIKVVKEVWR